MKKGYALFVPDGPSSPTAGTPVRKVADLSVRFPRAMAQGRSLATHYGEGSFVARQAASGEPEGDRHQCFVAPRSIVEVNRDALRKAVAP